MGQHAHRARCDRVAEREESGVASEPGREPRVADQSETDRGEHGADQAARDRVEQLCDEDGPEPGPEREHERAAADREHSDRRERALRAHAIDNGSRGYLKPESCERSGGEDQPDVALAPGHRREVGGHERPPSGLHVGEEEREGVERAQAAPRRQRRLGVERYVCDLASIGTRIMTVEQGLDRGASGSLS
jgi:hypothetical protein